MRSSRAIWPLLVGVLLISSRLAVADDIDEARARFQQAEAYFQAGAFDRAIAEYEAAYELAPRPVLLFNIGLCREHLGEHEQAIAHYDHYLREEPEGVKATEARARREALLRAVEAASDAKTRRARAEELRTRAQKLSTQDDHEGALEAIAQARELAPEPALHFELAEIYRRAGQPLLALTEYHRYLADAEDGAHRAEAARRVEELEADRARATTAPGPAPSEPRRARPSLMPALLGYAAAAVFTGVGGYYGTRARSDLSAIDEALAASSPPLDSGDPRFDAGKRKAKFANVAFALAGASLAAGAGLHAWARWPRPSSSRAERAALRPSFGPGVAGAKLEVRW